MSDEDESTHVNEPRIFDSSPIEIDYPFDETKGPSNGVVEMMAAKPEETAQDKGEPSPVPYSIFINRPVPSEQRPGDTVIDIKLAVAFRTDAMQLAPDEVKDYIDEAFKAFERGYYRFELVVGDWSIRIYKHPNNP
jgi:hypothetical protein